MTFKKYFSGKWLVAAAVFIVPCQRDVYAATELWPGTPVAITGTIIIPPPCVIQNDQVIEVDFGSRVGVNKVDGVNYLQDINYTLVCDAVDSSRTLSMTISGSFIDFENTALQTNMANLGIRLLKDGVPLNINNAFTFDYSNPPHLQAVPVKRSGSQLTVGDFEASATMLITYQ